MDFLIEHFNFLHFFIVMQYTKTNQGRGNPITAEKSVKQYVRMREFGKFFDYQNRHDD